MTFGSNEFFIKLKIGMTSGGSEEFYSEVLDVVKNHAYPRIASRVEYPDSDDVLQQVLISVWVSLSKYVVSSEHFTPAQRNAWLNRIIDNKIADYYREQYAKREDISAEETLINLKHLMESPDTVLEKVEEIEDTQDYVNGIINFICSMDIAPEKIIAFFYSKVIYFLEAGGTLKGSAKYAYEKINGKSLQELWQAFQLDLDAALDRHVPSSVLTSLREKIIESDLQCVISIKIDTISDSTNYIVKRIRKTKNAGATFEVR